MDPTEEIRQLELAIAALDAQRGTLGEAVVNAALAPMREKLSTLSLSSQTGSEQRKLVTILFADLVGFTALAEKMDPEDVREVLNLYFTRWTKALDQYGGQVEKFIGDAVMAVFGLPVAREDDPESAVRAALAMREALGKLNQELEPAYHLRLAMRIGIHTGPVVVSFLGERKGQDFVVVGDTVNLSSRLQTAAPEGGVLISHDTYQHIRGLFAIQSMDPILVKGKAEPVQVYIVQWAKKRGFRVLSRGIEGIETRTIGRESELARLQSVLQTAVDRKTRQWVTVVGEAGIGKSRLMYELDNWLELLPVVIRYFKGRATPARQYLPYALFRDMFSFRFEIQENDPPAVVVQKMEAGFADAVEDARQNQIVVKTDLATTGAHLVGRLLGFDLGEDLPQKPTQLDPRQLRDQAFGSMVDYFKTLAACSPLVLLLEDIHWADDSSLDVVNLLGHALADQPALIICTARPIFFERWPNWAQEQSAALRLDLQPLSVIDSRRLVAEILRKAEQVPGELFDLVVNNAEGNPFYIEELVKMLLDDGVIEKTERQWQIHLNRLEEIRLPSTLTGVLQARFDSLAPEEKLFLQRASVIGRVFWEEAVKYLETLEAAPAHATQAAPEILNKLRSREMIFKRDRSSFNQTDEYFFKHALLRDVTYESVLKRERKIYHALAARWLVFATWGSQRSDEFAALIADHFDHAGELAEAAAWYERAGLSAVDQFANSDAVRYISRALDLMPDVSDEKRFALLAARERVYELQGKRQLQARDLDALELLAIRLGGALPGVVAVRRAQLNVSTGNLAQGIEWATKAVGLADQAKDYDTETFAYVQWSSALWRGANYALAQEPLEKALALAEKAGLVNQQAECSRNLGILHEARGEYPQAMACFEKAYQLKRQLGDRRGESTALNSLAVMVMNLCRYHQALEYVEHSLRLKREIGDRRGEETGLNNLGLITYYLGDLTTAQASFERSLQVSAEIGDIDGVSSGHSGLALVAIASGDFAGGERKAEQALQLFREAGDEQGESEVHAFLSRLAFYRGDYQQGYQQALLGLDLANQSDTDIDRCRALNYLGHTSCELGYLEEAAQAYQQSYELRMRLGQFNLAMEPLSGLAHTAWLLNRRSLAQERVEEILAHIQTGDENLSALFGVDELFQVIVRACTILKGVRDERWKPLLERACRLLYARADKLKGAPDRQAYLKEIPSHRDLVAFHTEIAGQPEEA